MEIMPLFHKNIYESFGCMNKYTQNHTDYNQLTCDKQQIATIWETTVDIDISE